MKKLSVKTKYALILAAILAVLIGLQLLFNQVFMERFYLNRKLELVKELRSVTLEYIETCKNGENTDAQEMELRKSCEAAGVDVMIMQPDSYYGGVILFSNVSEQQGGAVRLINIMRGKQNQEALKIYAEGTDYRIYQTKDNFTGTEQSDCLGYVESDSTRAASSDIYYS